MIGANVLQVTCCLCGRAWDTTARGVAYRSADRRWWCISERDCRRRRDIAAAYQKVTLDRIIDLLAQLFEGGA